MQRVDGVQSVTVSLKDGLTILDLKPDNTVSLAKLRQVIKNNGFVSKEAQIVARGSTTGGGGAAGFEVSGTRERLVPIGQAQQTGEMWRMSIAAAPK
jgi:copper chaperone CopZ